jgi:hypothetical protein
MNKQEKLDLKKIVRDSECENNTDKIRSLKHSVKINQDIETMYKLKATHSKMRELEPDKFSNLCQSQCMFLYTYYTDIYHKLYKDELNLELMGNMLKILKQIEEGEVDQHEGSVVVGKILKKIYVDSALKRADKLDKENDTLDKEHEIKEEPMKICWKDYKQRM